METAPTPEVAAIERSVPSAPTTSGGRTRSERREAAINRVGSLQEAPAEPAVAEAAPESAPVDAAPSAETVEAAPAATEEIIKDPESAKRLAMVEKAAARKREQLDADFNARIKEIEARERKLAEKEPTVNEFSELAKRAKYDPLGVLRKLGLTDEDIDPAARQLWAHSPAAKADPKNREAADRYLREREQLSQFEATRAELTELKQNLAQERARAEIGSRVNAYLDRVTATVGDTAPYAKHMISSASKDFAREFIDNIAGGVHRELGLAPGEDPPEADVISAVNNAYKDHLKRMGVDLPTLIKPAAPAPVATKSIGAAPSAPTQVKENKKLTREERREMAMKNFKFTE